MIQIIRELPKGNSTFGVMFINKLFHGFTLENTNLIIPVGTYDFELYDSPNNNTIVPLLKDVTNRSYIEIHVANEYHELEGCIAVGNSKTDKMLLNSRDSFNSLMLKIRSMALSEYKIEIRTI